LEVKKDLYQTVTDTIIKDLEFGIRPWLQPWIVGGEDGQLNRPLRANGEPYRVINVLMLWGSSISPTSRGDLRHDGLELQLSQIIRGPISARDGVPFLDRAAAAAIHHLSGPISWLGSTKKGAGSFHQGAGDQVAARIRRNLSISRQLLGVFSRHGNVLNGVGTCRS
jgi:N-terminal domain of anti-restriction factor ArdC